MENLTMKQIKENIMANIENIPEENNLRELVQKLCQTNGKARPDSKGSIYRKMIEQDGFVTEDKLWEMFKWGRHEALSIAWTWRKKGEPENYLWVNFDKENRTYKLYGKGPIEPEDFPQNRKKKLQ